MCVIDHEQMQARVNGKYDVGQGDISSRFKVKLGNAMKEMHVSIEKQMEGKLSKDVSSRHLQTN